MRSTAGLTSFFACFSLLASGGCETAHPTYARVQNGYSGRGDQTVTVLKVWWSVALFAEPVAEGAISSSVRVVPARDYAYALLAPDWKQGEPPKRLIPVRTKAELSVARGHTLVIDLSPTSVLGDCAHGPALSQDEADFIAERIFPDEFAGAVYEAATCSLLSDADDASAGD